MPNVTVDMRFHMTLVFAPSMPRSVCPYVTTNSIFQQESELTCRWSQFALTKSSLQTWHTELFQKLQQTHTYPYACACQVLADLDAVKKSALSRMMAVGGELTSEEKSAVAKRIATA